MARFSLQVPKLDARDRKLALSYAVDWVIAIALAVIFFAVEKVPGYKRDFSLQDKTIQYPYAEVERVPNWALAVICFASPAVLLPIINLLTVRSKWDFHISWLGLVVSLSLTAVVSEVTKITVGRPRPDMISRCVPQPGSTDPPFGLSTSDICTADRNTYEFNDGWRSFPSGHSSLSFAGLGFLSFYLAGKLRLFDRQAYTFKVWLVITPLIGATLVAVSRTMDYRHHWQDVLSGSILGIVLSYLTYRQYYPPLHSADCHQPYPPRVRFDEPILPTHRDVDDRSSLEMYGHTENGFSHSPYHDTSDEEERTALTSQSRNTQSGVDLGTKDALSQSRPSI
ncbi:PAP2-domain-containing protein [Irpex rosettiformis]|uniref:PAP2-domain-containing protein n=1 Tax=Irpex rosettiformis TaxID=378272 RepID=A0ACB8UHP3_9APHY|nr:PAP2-domain-containing protein [Irpex rosettiformis]